jgi:hypothetical protein
MGPSRESRGLGGRDSWWVARASSSSCSSQKAHRHGAFRLSERRLWHLWISARRWTCFCWESLAQVSKTVLRHDSSSHTRFSVERRAKPSGSKSPRIFANYARERRSERRRFDGPPGMTDHLPAMGVNGAGQACPASVQAEARCGRGLSRMRKCQP